MLRQLRALVGAVVRELLWGLPLGARELSCWRSRALTIPDQPLRADAMHSLTRKRANSEGSALFSILTPRRSSQLVSLLVGYESIWDYLDNVSERGAAAGAPDGLQLHLALLEAVDCERDTSDYYRRHPWRDDGGYLAALVARCRECCLSLPSYLNVRRLLIEEGRRSAVGVCNHELESSHRDRALWNWAEYEFTRLPGLSGVAWFELSAAASCSAAAHALLAMAADPGCGERDARAVHDAYFPWFSIATTMLDSYVDETEDIAEGAHSYISHYPSREFAVQRTRRAIARSTRSVGRLRRGDRHAVIAACMVAMYASKDSARTRQTRATTTSLVRAGGPLTRALVPVLRLWRIAYGQQSA